MAFEMARQLHDRRREVELLAIFDEGPPDDSPAAIGIGPRWLVEWLRNLPYWVLEDAVRSQRGELRGRIRSRARLAAARVRRAFGGYGEAARLDIRDTLGMWRVPKESRVVLEREFRALTSYVPKVYDGRLTLFRARAGPLFRVRRSDMGWAHLVAGAIDVKVVPGSHVTMLTEPHVRVMAEELRTALDVTSCR